MDKFLAGLLGSALGAAVAVFVMQSINAPQVGDTPEALAEVEAQLSRIEAKLDQRSARAPQTLRGRAPEGVAAADFSPTSAQGKAFLEAVATRVKAATKEAVAEATPDASSAPPQRRARPRRQRKSLSDVATALELSSAEEEALRQLYAKSQNDFLHLLAGEEGDLDEVKRDLEALRERPEQAPLLMTKYFPRVAKDFGKVFAITQEQNRGVQEAIGAEKAERLRREFVVEESDPFGLQGRRWRQ